jgi:hypothetical protein
VIAEDCTAGISQETHQFMIENMLSLSARVATAREIEEQLSPAP